MSKFITQIEESFISLLMAAMVLVTFSQVVARYVFNSGALWALELTTYLFAWLVIFGISYGVKTHIHIGVDAFVKLFKTPVQRLFGLLAVLASIIYGGIMFYGGWVYVGKLKKIGIETHDMPIQKWLFLSILVIGMGLVIFRLLQAFWVILTAKDDFSILGDESKDAIEQFMGDDKSEEQK
ncbi:TRAP transporter small permease [Kiloniella sp. EL199]|uniref:TRAP transporter small permease n=1 Tax=Kiloniella sp. EL199 TaxID=2107581 RepID=UPI000EA1A27D|nr:TRAP transporter small permease [Kiloniella sp. EL199]